MPFVKIELFEGRSEEQKAELAREVTEVVSRIAMTCQKEPISQLARPRRKIRDIFRKTILKRLT